MTDDAAPLTNLQLIDDNLNEPPALITAYGRRYRLVKTGGLSCFKDLDRDEQKRLRAAYMRNWRLTNRPRKERKKRLTARAGTDILAELALTYPL